MARALAEFLFGSEKSLIRFDMSEFMEKHSVSKLIGSPPGYVGYEEGGQLTERVKRAPYSIILLDEIEKAHPDIYNILLQVFEDGQLTDGLGNTVDFKNTIIIMTSNLGARFLDKRGQMGFSAPRTTGIPQKIEDQVMSEVKRAFNPEFLNRLDEVILFTSLVDEDLLQDHRSAGGADQLESGGQADQDPAATDAAKYILDKTCATAATERVHCGVRCRSTSKIRCRRRSSRAHFPVPLSLDIYLGENGIYCRQVGDMEGQPVAAGDVESTPSPATPLYMFS